MDLGFVGSATEQALKDESSETAEEREDDAQGEGVEEDGAAHGSIAGHEDVLLDGGYAEIGKKLDPEAERVALPFGVRVADGLEHLVLIEQAQAGWIEPEGVARIRSYVGKLRQPQTFEEGADILRGLFAAQFPNFTSEQWHSAAQRTWKLHTGKLVLTYDPALAESLAEFDIEHPLPTLWNEFEALAPVPVLLIRGARSDILSEATLNIMRARHPDLESIEVPDQGHVPLLESAELIRRIGAFVEKCDDAFENV